jgi:ribonuclease HII
MSILGIDEAGRGPVIGPMAVAGVLVDDDEALDAIGVKDSKLLTPKQREALFGRIIRAVKGYQVLLVTIDEIDASVEEGNLNWLEADAMVKIIQHLKPTTAYLDCPSTNTQKFSEYIRERVGAVKIIAEHKADAKYPSVSAASILAKVTRDREIEKLHKIHGDFGSGYPADPRTQEFLSRHPELPIYRRSWSSWQRVAEKKLQKNLGDF